MNIITLNQLISWFQSFQERHFFLKDFGFGEPYDIGTSRQMDFPYMWMTLNDDSVIPVASNNKTAIPEISFSVLFMDKINDQQNYLDTNGFPSNNSQEILSDCVQYLQDLITEIQSYWNQYGVLFSQDVSFFPVIDETQDKATGINARIVLRLKQVNCIIPVAPIPTTPTPTPTNTATPTITPTETPVLSPSPTSTSTSTPTQTPTNTSTPTPTLPDCLRYYIETPPDMVGTITVTGILCDGMSFSYVMGPDENINTCLNYAPNVPSPGVIVLVEPCILPTPTTTSTPTNTETPTETPTQTPTTSPVPVPLSFTVTSGQSVYDSCNGLVSGTIYTTDLGNCAPCLPLTCFPCLLASPSQVMYLDPALTIVAPNGYYTNEMAPGNFGTIFILDGVQQPGGFTGGCPGAPSPPSGSHPYQYTGYSANTTYSTSCDANPASGGTPCILYGDSWPIDFNIYFYDVPSGLSTVNMFGQYYFPPQSGNTSDICFALDSDGDVQGPFSICSSIC